MLALLIGCPCAPFGQAASPPPQWLRLQFTLGILLASAARFGGRVTFGNPRRALLQPVRIAHPAAQSTGSASDAFLPALLALAAQPHARDL